MAMSLDRLISTHRESLTDSIVKDAIEQIPSYREAPLRLTMERTERWLDVLHGSISRNDPDILEQYLTGVAEERREAGFAIGELHAMVYITERHLQAAITSACTDQVECNALLAVLEAVMGAARMVLSIQYMLQGQDSRLTQHE